MKPVRLEYVTNWPDGSGPKTRVAYEGANPGESGARIEIGDGSVTGIWIKVDELDWYIDALHEIRNRLTYGASVGTTTEEPEP